MSATRVRVVARWNRSSDGRSGFLVGSLVTHAALAVALVAWPGWRGRAPLAGPSISVTLLAPQRGAPAARPAPPTALPPEPPKEPERVPAPKTVPREVKPAPEKRPAKPVAVPTRETPAPPAEGSAEPKPQDSSPAAGGPGSESGSVDLAGMGAEYDWYRDAVLRALFASWRQPPLDNPTVLEVGVAFEILRNGTVRNARIDSSSGVPAVDRSALRAVADATLPPLPREFSEPTQPARFVFRLDPES